MLDSSKKKRVFWIDAVKAICILLVFYRHCSTFYGVSIAEINHLCEPFYVNAFFFITGYFLFKKQLYSDVIEWSTKNYLREEGMKYWRGPLFSIVLPSIVFAAMFYIPKVLFKTHDYRISSFLIDTVGGGTYWFTSALVVGYLLTFLFLFFRIKNIWIYFGVALVFAPIGSFLGTLSDLPSWPWMYKQGLIAFVYMVSGGLFYKYEKDALGKWKIGYTWMLAVLYVAAVLFLWGHIKCTTSLCYFNFGGYLVSIIGTFLLVEFCKRLPHSRFLAFVGENSILFYFLSGGFPLFAAKIFGLLPVKNFALLIGVFLSSVVVSVLFVIIVKRYFPFLKDFRLLKRD